MKTYKILLVLMLLSTNLHAQWKQGEVPPSLRRNTSTVNVLDTTQIIAYYAFNADSINNSSTYIDLGWLQVGKDYIKYASYFMAQSDSAYKVTISRLPRNSQSAPCQRNGGKYPGYWSEYQYDELYIKDGKLTEYAIMPLHMGREVCKYTEDYPMQQWTLSSETKPILSYKCQKATCRWRGRDYEAWFTTEIPVRSGPWKFGGLPGLIIKIQDSLKEYTFECVKVEQTRRPITQYDFSPFREVKRESMLKLQKKININIWKVLGAVLDDGTPAPYPDHEYSPMELE